MVGVEDPDGDKASFNLELCLVGRQKWEQLRPSVISAVAGMILELVGLGLLRGWGSTPGREVSWPQKCQELVPSRIQNQIT